MCRSHVFGVSLQDRRLEQSADPRDGSTRECVTISASTYSLTAARRLRRQLLQIRLLDSRAYRIFRIDDEFRGQK
jgi:hypothetical protein